MQTAAAAVAVEREKLLSLMVLCDIIKISMTRTDQLHDYSAAALCLKINVICFWSHPLKQSSVGISSGRHGIISLLTLMYVFLYSL
jgi:hypothetical protein